MTAPNAFQLPESRSDLCTGECQMFGPETPQSPHPVGAGDCRSTCRLIRGEPKMTPARQRLFKLQLAAIALTGELPEFPEELPDE
ncbi:unnamed protein product [marine sediment metagenome]|uniref:Uncharacterized protein n=1 Tax=marine sediment metagenome TaxID=412755 RepID=X0VJ73_9ZZZZ